MRGEKFPVLYPVGSRVMTRDAGPGTVIEVRATARVWDVDPETGADVMVESKEERVGLDKLPVEPHYLVRSDMPGQPQGWRSQRMLSPLVLGGAG